LALPSCGGGIFLAEEIDKGLRKAGISVSTPVLAVICLVFGVLLIIFPNLVGYIVGIFLIIQGIILLVNYMESNRQQPTQRRTPPAARTPVEEPSETPPAPPPTME